MKKLILVTLLLVFIMIPFTLGGTVLAEEEGKLYYYTTDEIPAFANPDDTNAIFYIPATYAYQFNSEVTGKDVISISYNGIDCYIKKERHNSTREIKLDWEGNYFYTIDFDITSSDSTINIYVDNTITESNLCSPASVTINKVYSYHKIDNSYYFYINYKYGSFPEDDGYIKVSDTSLSGFTSASVPQNPHYVEETKPETPDEDDPSGDNPDGIVEPTNNLERYILIAVIAVLCVVIVVLVFLPNKNRKSN